jgi:hypothetical protein
MKITVLVAALVAMLPSAATAQICIGQPHKAVFVSGWRSKDGTLTGRLGVRPGAMGSLTANVAKPNDPDNGSKSISYGGRVTYGPDRGSWGVCVLAGAQVGFSHLINAEGIRHNAQITAVSVPLGLGFGKAVRITGGTRLILSALPQLLFRNHEIMLYSRADTVSVGTARTEFGASVAADLQLGPLRVGASAFKSQDVPLSWTVGAGVGW